MRLPPVKQRSVLVTGCSSGIGAATARLLRKRGWTVIPTARKPEDLARLRAEGYTPVELDIANEESVTRCAKAALDLTGGELGGIVNNAGFGQAGAIEDLSRDLLRQQFEVNLIGMQDLTNRLIPTFRKQGYGRIVNISSVLGRVSMPFNGIYSATKFAMEALADAMRIELLGSGVGIILIEPGPIISQFRASAVARAEATLNLNSGLFSSLYKHEVERRHRQQQKPNLFTKPPEAVAAKVVKALESSNPKRRYGVTIPAHIGAFIARFAPPAMLDWAMAAKKR